MNLILRLNSDFDNIMDPYNQQENDKVNDFLTEDIDDSERCSHSADVGNNNLMSNKLPDIINEHTRSLNMKQREVFNFIHKWSRDYIQVYVVK